MNIRETLLLIKSDPKEIIQFMHDQRKGVRSGIENHLFELSLESEEIINQLVPKLSDSMKKTMLKSKKQLKKISSENLVDFIPWFPEWVFEQYCERKYTEGIKYIMRIYPCSELNLLRIYAQYYQFSELVNIIKESLQNTDGLLGTVTDYINRLLNVGIDSFFLNHERFIRTFNKSSTWPLEIFTEEEIFQFLRKNIIYFIENGYYLEGCNPFILIKIIKEHPNQFLLPVISLWRICNTDEKLRIELKVILRTIEIEV